ncbi:MAG: hypothetical protein ABF868_07650 [Sporolactobacillus sp.]
MSDIEGYAQMRAVKAESTKTMAKVKTAVAMMTVAQMIAAMMMSLFKKRRRRLRAIVRQLSIKSREWIVPRVRGQLKKECRRRPE